jgi:hypothetical protein
MFSTLFRSLAGAAAAVVGIRITTEYYRFDQKGILTPEDREVIFDQNNKHKRSILKLLKALPSDSLIGGSYGLRSFMINRDPDNYWQNNDIDVFVSVKDRKEYKQVIQRFEDSIDDDEHLILSEKRKYYPDTNRPLSQKEADQPDSRNEEFHLNVKCVSIFEVYIKGSQQYEYIQIVGILPLEFNSDLDYLKKTKSGHAVIHFDSFKENVVEDVHTPPNTKVRYYASLFDTLNQIVDLPTKVFIGMDGDYRMTEENAQYIVSKNIPSDSICPMRREKYSERGFTFFGPETPNFISNTKESEKYPSLTEPLVPIKE